VELPEGVWYDWWTGLPVGPGAVVHPAPLGRPPLFVRAGACLTLGNRRASTAEPMTELILEVFPGADGHWTLVEDDGETTAWRDGVLAETRLAVRQHADGRVETNISARRGPYVPHPRELVLRLHLPAPPRALRLDGVRAPDWRWDGQRRCAELRRADDGCAHEVEVEPEPGPA
jgi:alpha-glucosidase